MSYEKTSPLEPRLIIHGGAGNITRQNLPEKAYNAYRSALLAILHEANFSIRLPGATALDVATSVVTQLENNGLFNSGHGAVYTAAGTHELEASVMVSRGYRKRGVGVMGVKKAKNPILLARQMLLRGEREDGGGAQGHCQLHGETCDRLAEEWDLETVKPSYFWTRKRWDEHRRGLGLKHDRETYKREKRKADEEVEGACEESGASLEFVESEDASAVDGPGWDGKEYLPQGTVGAVVMDRTGTICVATSTGGLTNKLPGRIGDTPTLGAGFWAEEWSESRTVSNTMSTLPTEPHVDAGEWLTGCLNQVTGALSAFASSSAPRTSTTVQRRRAVALGGTGNGDSFLRLAAARTAAAMARFSPRMTSNSTPNGSATIPLQNAVSCVAGPNGTLQQSAEDRWLKTGEGEGGIIGIDLDGGRGKVVFDYNCGGMFHVWFDDAGKAKFQVFRDRVDEG